jgi:hypothetical protein
MTYDDNPRVTGDYVWISCDDTSGRRSRAAQIIAHKRRYMVAHNVTLAFSSVSYSESDGFLSRTAIRYRITR